MKPTLYLLIYESGMCGNFMIYFINQHTNFPLQRSIGWKVRAQGDISKFTRPKKWLSPDIFHYRPMFGCVDTKFNCNSDVVIRKYNEDITCSDWLADVKSQESLMAIDISVDPGEYIAQLKLIEQIYDNRSTIVDNSIRILWKEVRQSLEENERLREQGTYVTKFINGQWIDNRHKPDDVYMTTYVASAWRNDTASVVGLPTIFDNDKATKMASFTLGQHSIDFHIAHPNFFKSNDYYDIKYIVLTTAASNWPRLNSDLPSYKIKMNRNATDLKLLQFNELYGEDNIQEIYIDTLLNMSGSGSNKIGNYSEYEKLLAFIDEDKIINWNELIEQYKKSAF